MLKKKLFVIVGILIVIGLTFNITLIGCIASDETVSTVAEKDAYIYTYNPTSNYGGKNWLIFGDRGLGWTEAYLYFNFSDKPAGWTKAEISIDMYYVSETFNVMVCLISDTWNEYTINWVNKPEHKEIITTFTVAEGKIYKIDITDFIQGRNSISICVNASNNLQTGYVQGHSKEGAYSSEDYPQLIWTYPEPEYSGGYFLGIVVLFGIGAVLCIGVPVGIYKLYKKKTEERKIFITQEPKDILAKKAHYCQNCGKEIIPNTKFCTKCGHDTSI